MLEAGAQVLIIALPTVEVQEALAVVVKVLTYVHHLNQLL